MDEIQTKDVKIGKMDTKMAPSLGTFCYPFICLLTASSLMMWTSDLLQTSLHQNLRCYAAVIKTSLTEKTKNKNQKIQQLYFQEMKKGLFIFAFRIHLTVSLL